MKYTRKTKLPPALQQEAENQCSAMQDAGLRGIDPAPFYNGMDHKVVQHHFTETSKIKAGLAPLAAQIESAERLVALPFDERRAMVEARHRPESEAEIERITANCIHAEERYNFLHDEQIDARVRLDKLARKMKYVPSDKSAWDRPSAFWGTMGLTGAVELPLTFLGVDAALGTLGYQSLLLSIAVSIALALICHLCGWSIVNRT